MSNQFIYQEAQITSEYTVMDGMYLKSTPPIFDYHEYLRSLTDDYELLECIAEKESGWRMVWNYMHDIDPNKYTAYGFFQILESTARNIDPKLDRMDPYENIQLAVKIYEKGGVTPWLVGNQCKK